jgi:hypothetical protein
MSRGARPLVSTIISRQDQSSEVLHWDNAIRRPSGDQALALEARREAAREQRLARLVQAQAVVVEIQLLMRWGGNTQEKERHKERLTSLVQSLGGSNALPSTSALAHWHHPDYKNAVLVAEGARGELAKAIDETFGH